MHANMTVLEVTENKGEKEPVKGTTVKLKERTPKTYNRLVVRRQAEQEILDALDEMRELEEVL